MARPRWPPGACGAARRAGACAIPPWRLMPPPRRRPGTGPAPLLGSIEKDRLFLPGFGGGGLDGWQEAGEHPGTVSLGGVQAASLCSHLTRRHALCCLVAPPHACLCVPPTSTATATRRRSSRGVRNGVVVLRGPRGPTLPVHFRPELSRVRLSVYHACVPPPRTTSREPLAAASSSVCACVCVPAPQGRVSCAARGKSIDHRPSCSLACAQVFLCWAGRRGAISLVVLYTSGPVTCA